MPLPHHVRGAVAAVSVSLLAAACATLQPPAASAPPASAPVPAAGAAGRSAPDTPVANGDPDRAAVITDDIPRFWRAYDGATLAGAAERFQQDYLDAGTAGLRDYARGNGSMPTGRHLAGAVAARPRYYAAVRATTLALDTSRVLTDALRAGFGRVKAAYPDAVFPEVYLVIGRLQSGGTVSPRGLRENGYAP